MNCSDDCFLTRLFFLARESVDYFQNEEIIKPQGQTMKRKATGVFLSLLVLFAGAWSPTANSANIPEVGPDQGLVVFYRPSSFKGGGIRVGVNHAEGLVGQLGNGTYLYKFLSPGAHTFWSQVISQDTITVNVEAGKTYFVLAEVRMGVYAGRPKFTLVSEAQASSALAAMN